MNKVETPNGKAEVVSIRAVQGRYASWKVDELIFENVFSDLILS
jgi:hypothetical protein